MGGTGIGLLHPGEMGAAVGGQLVATGERVYWLPIGRGAGTRQRAEAAGLTAVGSLTELAEQCRMIVSVCPPAVAREVAEGVAATDFRGSYLDANAISPAHSQEIAQLLAAATVVDGGIVGPPPRRAGTTRLYLCGPDEATAEVAAAFAGTALLTTVLSGPVGRASALKLGYAAYNKICHAVAASAAALADGYGVLPELLELAAESLPGSPLGRVERLVSAGPRAWRWAPEMREIAEADVAVGVPPELALAAARLLERWRDHRDDHEVTLATLLADLTDR